MIRLWPSLLLRQSRVLHRFSARDSADGPFFGEDATLGSKVALRRGRGWVCAGEVEWLECRGGGGI